MNEIIIYTVGFFLPLVISIVLTPYIAKLMRRIGKIGIDIHKVERPEVPESVGLVIAISVLIGMTVLLLQIPDNDILFQRTAIMIVILVLVTIIGLVDDFRPLSAVLKPGFLLLASIPIAIWQVADPYPAIPIVGEVRITIVYWAIAVSVVAITSNASNMIDVLNGSMSGSFIIIASAALISSFIIPLSYESTIISRYVSLLLLGSLIGFWFYNRYPAKVFAGDTGSLVTGATIGLIAIYGELEFVLIIAMLPLITNSFSILSSIGGLIERRQMKSRPISVNEGILVANKDLEAPITLVRLLTARNPMREKDIVNGIYMLVLYSSILAIISAVMIRGSL